jgi:hypothetical protein
MATPTSSIEITKQLRFQGMAEINRRFNPKTYINYRLDYLAVSIPQLSVDEIVWLSRLEDFFIKHNYMTRKQLRVLDQIFKRHLVKKEISEQECAELGPETFGETSEALVTQ